MQRVSHYKLYVKTFSIIIDNNSSMCQIPLNPYDGFSAFIYGSPGDACSVVEFSCENGSRLIGEPILTCQPNGEFNYPLPTCSGKYFSVQCHVMGWLLLFQLCI